jgi:hypothetical protein
VNVSSRNRSAFWRTLRGEDLRKYYMGARSTFLGPIQTFWSRLSEAWKMPKVDGTLCLKQDQCDTFPSDRVARGRFHFPLREAGKHRGNQLSQSPWLLGCDSSDHHASITMTDLRLLIGPHRIACLLCPQHEYLGRFD